MSRFSSSSRTSGRGASAPPDAGSAVSSSWAASESESSTVGNAAASNIGDGGAGVAADDGIAASLSNRRLSDLGAPSVLSTSKLAPILRGPNATICSPTPVHSLPCLARSSSNAPQNSSGLTGLSTSAASPLASSCASVTRLSRERSLMFFTLVSRKALTSVGSGTALI